MESPFLGAAAAPLRAARLDQRDLLAGDPLPALDELDGIISFGGAQSVTEIDRYPYLVEEAALLREAVERDIPVLGDLPRRPAARARARRQRPEVAATGGDVGRSWRALAGR